MRVPIVADNRGDVLVFDSVSEAESYIEPIDARNDEYEIFDAEGRRLKVAIVKEGWHEQVRLQLPAESIANEDGLKTLLLDFLSRTKTGRPEHADKLNLAEVLELLPRTR